MYHEIERKFLIVKMPDISSDLRVPQEIYFIQRGALFEEELKKKGSLFLYESRFTLSQKEKTREKIIVTKEEFERYKSRGTQSIERDSYLLSKDDKPIVSIKIYKGIYKGLELAEVLFDSVDEMENFVPYEWMGQEVTDTPLGKDSKLVDLTKEEYKELLNDVLKRSEAMSDGGGFL